MLILSIFLPRNSVHFPGALNSKFSNTLKFQKSEDTPAIPTYRLIDTNGALLDTSREPDLSKEKALKMYRDMVASKSPSHECNGT